MESSTLNWLKEYIKETPFSELKEQWSSIQEMGLNGPTVKEYLDFLHCKYSYDLHENYSINQIESENMTPNFLESFFLSKIAI